MSQCNNSIPIIQLSSFQHSGWGDSKTVLATLAVIDGCSGCGGLRLSCRLRHLGLLC